MSEEPGQPPASATPLDQVQAFQTYVAFNGDCNRTAVALGVAKSVVEAMRDEGSWEKHAEQWRTLQEGSSQDVSILVNRAVNFVQAHRLRGLIDKVVGKLSELPPDELVNLLSTKTRTKDGKFVVTGFSARQLTDLTKAAEAAHLMTQRALGDTVAERPQETRRGSSIALQVQQAMLAADCVGVDSVGVVREQLKIAAPAPPESVD